MLFHSLEFLLFAVAFFFVWSLVRDYRRLRLSWIVLASAFFYGWWDWRYLGLLFISAAVDFWAALAIVRFPSHRKLWLVASMAANLGILGLFKYAGFASQSANYLLAMLGLEAAIPVHHFILPVGISFYTFQTMSYTIDVYRGRLKPTNSFLLFLSYISFFPQLVAGPIERASDLLGQLERPPKANDNDRWEGLCLIAQGFFKKVVVADNVAYVVNQAFSESVLSTSAIYWWFIAAMFAVQIYCDFSGYTDIARGLARWMGISLCENFRRPYLATSLREFWNRWHISLSTWFRDYVYIPLGGSQTQGFSAYRNLWITMLLSGLWHGAAWTFVLWGAVHATFLSIERITRWPASLMAVTGGRYVAVGLTLVQVLIAWVLFRAESASQALAIIQSMVLGDWTELPPEMVTSRALVAAMSASLIVMMDILSEARERGGVAAPLRWHQGVTVGITLAAAVFLRGPGQAFVYFQF